MNYIFIIICMIFCHIVDDYYLQGWLSSAKQKSWWKNNAPNPLYKYDYIWALIMHSFSWSFMIMLPITIYLRLQITLKWLIMFIINVIAHAIIDNEKANRQTINLWMDQLLHMLQIIITIIVVLII